MLVWIPLEKRVRELSLTRHKILRIPMFCGISCQTQTDSITLVPPPSVAFNRLKLGFMVHVI